MSNEIDLNAINYNDMSRWMRLDTARSTSQSRRDQEDRRDLHTLGLL